MTQLIGGGLLSKPGRFLSLALIIAFLLVAVSLCVFLRENAFLQQKTTQRILTFAYREGYVAGQDAAYGSVTFMEKRNFAGHVLMIAKDRNEVMVIRIPADEEVPVSADPDFTHPQEFVAIWERFDRNQAPISQQVVQDVLWRNLRSDQEWAKRYAVHHFGLPFQVLYGLAGVGLRMVLSTVGLDGAFFLCRSWLLVLAPVLLLFYWTFTRRKGIRPLGSGCLR